MGCYDMPVEKHPLPEGVRDNTTATSPAATAGATSICAANALDGMELYGLLVGVERTRDRDVLRFQRTFSRRERRKNAQPASGFVISSIRASTSGDSFGNSASAPRFSSS